MTTAIDLPMLKKQVYSFHCSTGIDFDELFAEASLAYCKAKKEWKKEEGAKFNTYLHRTINNCLMSYTANEYKHYSDTSRDAVLYWQEMDRHKDNPEDTILFYDKLNEMEPKSKELCILILKTPQEFLVSRSSKVNMGALRDKLRMMGWSWPQIWNSFAEIKTVLSFKEGI